MEYNIFELAGVEKQKKELAKLVQCNEKTEQFGLMLTDEDAKELIICRNDSLKKYNRIEFGSGILDRLVYEFSDSQYIDQHNYVETLEQLQDIFYEFKNETREQMSDDELLSIMRELFEEQCGGDLEYLEGTCLPEYLDENR